MVEHESGAYPCGSEMPTEVHWWGVANMWREVIISVHQVLRRLNLDYYVQFCTPSKRDYFSSMSLNHAIDYHLILNSKNVVIIRFLWMFNEEIFNYNNLPTTTSPI